MVFQPFNRNGLSAIQSPARPALANKRWPVLVAKHSAASARCSRSRGVQATTQLKLWQAQRSGSSRSHSGHRSPVYRRSSTAGPCSLATQHSSDSRSVAMSVRPSSELKPARRNGLSAIQSQWPFSHLIARSPGSCQQALASPRRRAPQATTQLKAVAGSAQRQQPLSFWAPLARLSPELAGRSMPVATQHSSDCRSVAMRVRSSSVR
jgi:hypothetical protein